MTIECPGCDGTIESDGPVIIHGCGELVNVEEQPRVLTDDEIQELEEKSKDRPQEISEYRESYDLLLKDVEVVSHILEWMPESVVEDGDKRKASGRALATALHLVSCHEKSILTLGVKEAADAVGLQTNKPVVNALLDIEEEYGPRHDWDVWRIIDEELWEEN